MSNVKTGFIRAVFTGFMCILLVRPALALADIEHPPTQLIAKTHSSTQVALEWRAPIDSEQVVAYRVFRDGKRIGKTKETFYVDTSAVPGSEHTYFVVAFARGKIVSEPSNVDTVKTLINDDNSGLHNGSVLRVGVLPLGQVCGTNSIEEVPAASLDACLDTVIEHYMLKEGLNDLRAFVARLRRAENRSEIELGKRLFHSKVLSKNYDTSCSSCHHPAVGCGGDGLSMPIGVAASDENVIGLGRHDGNVVPRVGRNSQPICNSALWVESMFWDKRVTLQQSNAESTVGMVSTAPIRTPERDVTDVMNEDIAAEHPRRLLVAQAHFPVVAEAEMGSAEGFESPQEYREYLAGRLQTDWGELFNDVYGSVKVTYLQVAEALAAYQASFLFIDNPFFDYIDGNKASLSETEKRGALFFLAGSGCANCHDGVMFTPERTRGPLYPQFGIHGVGDGNAKTQFRMPSLLNVGLTAPYGDKGAFATLERVIQHYSDTVGSLQGYFENNEVCLLPQFAHLNGEQCAEVVGEGADFTLETLAAQRAASDRGDNAIIRGYSEKEVEYLAAFLRSLTDPKAIAGSEEINALIPPRDGGPDGHQLDATDVEGNSL